MVYPVTPVKKTFQYGAHSVTLETGAIARQATAAVIVTVAQTVVMVTVVAKKEAKEGQEFFPLTVDYMERTYAGGRIPGGFFKREGRPSEKETLTSRLIDRPIRPLFVEGFKHETQVVITVLSHDMENDPDIVGMVAASAALTLSGVPFLGPIGAARVGLVDGQYVLNPMIDEMAKSELDLVVAGTGDAVMMVESEAKELTEKQMLEAVMYGHRGFQLDQSSSAHYPDFRINSSRIMPLIGINHQGYLLWETSGEITCASSSTSTSTENSSRPTAASCSTCTIRRPARESARCDWATPKTSTPRSQQRSARCRGWRAPARTSGSRC